MYEKEEKTKWKVEHAEFFHDCKNMPATVRLDKAVVGGRTRFGIVIQFFDRYLGFSIADLDNVIDALTRMRNMVESMSIKYTREDLTEGCPCRRMPR